MEKTRTTILAIILVLVVLFSIGYVGKKLDGSGEKLGAQTQYYGGIVPHHLLADAFITDFFTKIQRQNPTTIILIGPNHKEEGDSLVLTSDTSFYTPEGALETHQEHIEQLLSNTEISLNNEIVQTEHSMNALVPYVKEFAPDATIIPLVVSNLTTIDELDKIAQTLRPYIDQDTVVVGAFDFSHYLKRDDAALNDIETLVMIKNREYEKLLSLDNVYTDSPAGLVLLLKLMELNESDHMHLIENTNSGVLLDDPYIETTSYFEIGFTN